MGCCGKRGGNRRKALSRISAIGRARHNRLASALAIAIPQKRAVLKTGRAATFSHAVKPSGPIANPAQSQRCQRFESVRPPVPLMPLEWSLSGVLGIRRRLTTGSAPS